MVRYLVLNSVYCIAAYVASYFIIRRMPGALRAVMAAWVVVAAEYVPFAYGLAQQLGGAVARRSPIAAWATLTPLLILTLVAAALALSSYGRHDLAALGLVIIAADVLLFHVFGVELAMLRWPVWTWGIPVLSVATLIVLGHTALRSGWGRRRTRG